MNQVAPLLLEDLETREVQDFQDDQGAQGRMGCMGQLELKEQWDCLGLVSLGQQALKVMLDMMGNPEGLVNRDYQGLMELQGFLV